STDPAPGTSAPSRDSGRDDGVDVSGRAAGAEEPSAMFILVVGGVKVGYYLAKELIENGHEVVVMEKDRGRADQIADELGSIVVAHDGCEGAYLRAAGIARR